MTTQTLKIKNGAINLPKRLGSSWRNVDIYLQSDKDTILIKRLKPPKLSEMLDEMNQVGKDISRKYLDEAIKLARSS